MIRPPGRRRFLGRAATLFLTAAATGARAQALPGERLDTNPPRGPDVIYVPTPDTVVEAMLKAAGVTRGDVVYDLGCGDGRIVVTAARRFGARGVGIDIDPQRIVEANENVRRSGVGRLVEIRQADLFQTDFREASVVTLYLLPELNRKLKPKLLAELRPGSRIVSHAFDMGPDWPPERTISVDGRSVYLWRVPAAPK